MPIGPDGQPLQSDAAAVAGAQQGLPHPQYYPLHPAAYPPFAAYPHAAGAYPTVMTGHMLAQPVSAGTVPGPGTAVETGGASPTAATSTVNGNGNRPESSKSAGSKDDNAPEGGGSGRGRKRGKNASNGDQGMSRRCR